MRNQTRETSEFCVDAAKARVVFMIPGALLQSVDEYIAEQNLAITRAAGKARNAQVAALKSGAKPGKVMIRKPTLLSRTQVLEALLTKGWERLQQEEGKVAKKGA